MEQQQGWPSNDPPRQNNPQQQFLPPWYRSTSQPAQSAYPANHSSSQQQPFGGFNGPAGQPPPGYGAPSSGQWGGGSNGSSSTAYSNSSSSNGWRNNSPSPYHRPYTPGRGSSPGGGGPRFAGGGYGGPGYSSGRGYGPGRGYGGRGRGSPSPQRAPSPPVWVKDDCWLLPKPGSVEAAAHAAAVARHRQQQRQQAQQQQRSDSVTVAAAAVAADAHAVAAVAAASEAADNEGVIDLTHGSDDDAVDPTAAAEAGPDGFASPSKAALIDLTGQTTVPSPTTAVSQQLSGLQLLLQQYREQPQQQQQQAAAAPSPRVVYIMRGLPGSGKSTRAAQIAAEARAAAGTNSNSSRTGTADPVVSIHSTDSYFCNPVSGEYVFNAELLSANHQKNFDAFCASLAAGVGTVIVDNTNLQPWQYEKYVQQAWAAGYRVREEVVGDFTQAAVQLYSQRNVHGVPLDKMSMMLEQWQH